MNGGAVPLFKIDSRETFISLHTGCLPSSLHCVACFRGEPFHHVEGVVFSLLVRA